jgi:hypothetical protein
MDSNSKILLKASIVEILNIGVSVVGSVIILLAVLYSFWDIFYGNGLVCN